MDVRHRGYPRLEALERRLSLSRWVASSMDLAKRPERPDGQPRPADDRSLRIVRGLGGQTPQLASQYPDFSFRGTSILAQFKEATLNFNEFQTELENLGGSSGIPGW